jgi:hypothetical protein
MLSRDRGRTMFKGFGMPFFVNDDKNLARNLNFLLFVTIFPIQTLKIQDYDNNNSHQFKKLFQ